MGQIRFHFRLLSFIEGGWHIKNSAWFVGPMWKRYITCFERHFRSARVCMTVSCVRFRYWYSGWFALTFFKVSARPEHTDVSVASNHGYLLVFWNDLSGCLWYLYYNEILLGEEPGIHFTIPEAQQSLFKANMDMAGSSATPHPWSYLQKPMDSIYHHESTRLFAFSEYRSLSSVGRGFVCTHLNEPM